MLTPGTQVALVAAIDFGDQLAELAEQMPVWIAETGPNRVAAEILLRDTSPYFEVTTFAVDEAAAPLDWAAGIIGTVLEHHGPFSQHPPAQQLVFTGAESEETLRQRLAKYGFLTIESSASGFTASA